MIARSFNDISADGDTVILDVSSDSGRSARQPSQHIQCREHELDQVYVPGWLNSWVFAAKLNYLTIHTDPSDR